MTTITVEEAARMCNIKIRSARAKLSQLAKRGKATQLNPKVCPNSPALYELHIPLKDLLMDQERHKWCSMVIQTTSGSVPTRLT